MTDVDTLVAKTLNGRRVLFGGKMDCGERRIG